jgi:hypothetical protein
VAKMHCYLHIGTEKTGTTLIQDFLSRNSSELHHSGVAYLESAGSPNNIWLVVASYDLDRRDQWTDYKKIQNDLEMETLQKLILMQMKLELQSKNVSSLIISSEHIQSRLTRLSEIHRLKKNLMDLGIKSFSVVVYIRNPIELAGSLYSTSLKSGSTAIMPELPSSPRYAQVCNHRRTIENFSNVFFERENKIIIRIFERDELKNSSVLDDFLEIINIPNSNIFKRATTDNKGLSWLGLCLLRHINLYMPRFHDENIVALRRKTYQKFEEYFTNEKYVLPQSLRKAYDEAFKESNEWVRVNFFEHKKNLFKNKKYSIPDERKFSEDILNKLSLLYLHAMVGKK